MIVTGQANRKTDTRKKGLIDTWVNGGRKDGRAGGRRDGQTDGWMDG
jgi:hypothetical protein